jgi:pimeloyl-ACP methyl ester carboxylesterase
MERTTIDGVRLEYEVRGDGEPVVLVHGSHVAETFVPLLAEPALAGRFRLIRYHRRGFAGSMHSEGPVSIAEQADDCGALLRALGIERAHVAGHSYGGAIALQLALDAPEMVHSLALLEPAVTAVPSAEQFMAGMAVVGQLYEAGDKAGAVDAFLRAVCGPEYRAVVDRILPGAMEQAVTDADTFFQIEMPALLEWRFTEEEARRITQPVLAVLGRESGTNWQGFVEGHEVLRTWLPQAERLVLPEAAHLLQVQYPRDLAEALAGFFAHHPLVVSV